MIIEYRKPIFERMCDAFNEAKKENKIISRFVLETDEYHEFYAEAKRLQMKGVVLNASQDYFMGIKVDKKSPF